jgi:hypothetical protein
MSVLLAHTDLGIQRRPTGGYDAQGNPTPGDPGEVLGPLPGRARQRDDGAWEFALDPDLWPVEEGDFVVEPATRRRWVITSGVALLRNTLDPTVDYVRAEGAEKTPIGTEPVGGVNSRGL